MVVKFSVQHTMRQTL